MRIHYNPEMMYRLMESRGTATKVCEKCKKRKPIRFFPPHQNFQQRMGYLLFKYCHACCSTPTIYLVDDYEPPNEGELFTPPKIRTEQDM